LNARKWIQAYSDRLGTASPTTDEFRLLLDLAGEAAHSSERVAAPVACWVAAKAGLTPAEALNAARDIGDDG
jgi:uncharacterized protein DUF6457